jgi:putative toxin-antitoxin system antitoxin component (TIGR02293 family)
MPEADMNDQAIPKILDLHLDGPMGPTSLMTEVEKGLPLSALDRIAGAVAPGDPGFAARMVPRATLARRRKALAHGRNDAATRLSAEESARVARLAAVWAFAREVFGRDDAARSFLFSPNLLLDMRRPVDVVLTNELGRPLVEGILGGLRYGMAV